MRSYFAFFAVKIFPKHKHIGELKTWNKQKLSVN